MSELATDYLFRGSFEAQVAAAQEVLAADATAFAGLVPERPVDEVSELCAERWERIVEVGPVVARTLLAAPDQPPDVTVLIDLNYPPKIEGWDIEHITWQLDTAAPRYDFPDYRRGIMLTPKGQLVRTHQVLNGALARWIEPFGPTDLKDARDFTQFLWDSGHTKGRRVNDPGQVVWDSLVRRFASCRELPDLSGIF
jgi:hypothetical protein